MYTGQATLFLPGGREVPVEYQFGGIFDDTRVGYLICDTTKLDTGALCERLRLACDDGSEVVLAVMHTSDKHLAITGRVAKSSSGGRLHYLEAPEPMGRLP